MKRIIYAAIAVFMLACTEKEKSTTQEIYSTDGKKVTVYTTADSTDMRLALTGTLEFKQKGQPFENEISVFVDPTKTYQEFLGVGGALTDASAETFAKLPAGKQQEFLKAYFDKDNGIGYTLARTNIHSCDFSSDTYTYVTCLLYTSDAADERSSVDLGGRR